MKLYWYELKNGEIKQSEYEVKETMKQYKSLEYTFPNWYMIIGKSDIGKILKRCGEMYVYFTEKNLGKARDLFVEAQKKAIERTKNQIEKLEDEIEELERQIDRLEDMEVQNG